MPTTSPDDQYYASDGSTLDIAVITAQMATNSQAAFSVRTIKSWKPANKAALDALAGMTNGDEAYQIDTGTTWIYNSGWKVNGSSNWTSYSASPSGISVGTGSSVQTFEWRYEGDRIRVRYNMKLGTTGFSVTGNPVSIALPFTAAPLAGPYMIYDGVGGALDAGSQFFPTFHLADNISTTRARIYTLAPSLANITATVPFTWGAADVLAGEFVYQPA